MLTETHKQGFYKFMGSYTRYASEISAIISIAFYTFLIVSHNPNMKSIDCNQGTDSFTCGIDRQ